MSMMDHILNRPTKRADQSGALRGGRTWFSRHTINKAKQFSDVSWLRLLAPAILGIGLMVAGQTLLAGDGAAFANLAGLLIFIFSLNGIISRAWQDITHR
ncbi:MAG: hypothetical protein P8P99_04590 [Maricaulis sp.]|nr:hypothetical protein [Maricaulis sp.]